MAVENQREMCIALLAAGYRDSETTAACAAHRAVRQVDDACRAGKLGELWRNLETGKPEQTWNLYRTGTHNNTHNIYLVKNTKRRDADEHVGMMFTPQLTRRVVLALNAYGVA